MYTFFNIQFLFSLTTDIVPLDEGPGAGDGSSYGTGAGYGGSGGRSTSTQKTGTPYGDYKMPTAFGSGGGRGGTGGGALRIRTLEALVVEGMINLEYSEIFI